MPLTLIKSRRLRYRHRAGLSMLETMMAVAVLLVSVLALSQLASIGRMHSQRAARMTQAQILCQNQMAKIAAGVDSAIPVVDQPFPSAPQWAYTIEVQPTRWQDLVAVEVSVREVPLVGDQLAGPKPTVTPNMEPDRPVFRLVRWFPVRAASSGIESMDKDADEEPDDDGSLRQNVAGESLSSFSQRDLRTRGRQ